MLTYADFVAEYPEFTNVAEAFVTAKLTLAEGSIDATVWGSSEDEGHGLLTAHHLAMSPDGAQAGLRVGDGAEMTSIYWGRYDELRKRVGRAYRLVLP